MKPEEINKAIAETCGFKFIQRSCKKMKGVSVTSDGYLVEIPNYHGSLDAIVPVVRALKSECIHKVAYLLFQITLHGPMFSSHLATPAQWCEAYLKAKGLWNE
jgi:hypothetical protein